LVETYKQTAWMPPASNGLSDAMARAKTIDGYMLVQKAQTLTGDKSMAFALVAMSVDKTHGVDQLRAHIAAARDAAKTDASVSASSSPTTTGASPAGAGELRLSVMPKMTPTSRAVPTI